MELKEAIQQLKTLNEWRRFDGEIEDSPEMPNPKKIGIAIDKVVSEFENLFISGVMHRCISCEDIDRSFDTLFAYIEKKEPWFKREQYIAYATMIAETIEMEKKLNGA